MSTAVPNGISGSPEDSVAVGASVIESPRRSGSVSARLPSEDEASRPRGEDVVPLADNIDVSERENHAGAGGPLGGRETAVIQDFLGEVRGGDLNR